MENIRIMWDAKNKKYELLKKKQFMSYFSILWFRVDMIYQNSFYEANFKKWKEI